MPIIFIKPVFLAREAISKIPLMKLVARMINIRPDDRLSTSDVLSGPGFNNFNPLRDICQQIKNRKQFLELIIEQSISKFIS